MFVFYARIFCCFNLFLFLVCYDLFNKYENRIFYLSNELKYNKISIFLEIFKY